MRIASYVNILALSAIILSGCCHKLTDQVRVEKVIEYRDRIIHDTTTFTVEKEVEKIVTRDTVSHLENSWAMSDAVVSGGFLEHSLESKPQVVKVPVEVIVRDTVVVEKEAEIRTETKYVEKDLSWWQEARLWAFPLLLGLLLWAYRKPLWALIKTLVHIA